ncbi:Flp pilus assembly protein CpaB [Shewanella gaetbuli]
MSFKQSKSSWFMLIIAILIAVMAFWLANNYLENKEQTLKSQFEDMEPDTVAVVVASADIAVGEVISAANMAIASVSAEHLSTAVISPEAFGQFEGQVVKYSMSAGEPLLSHYVSGLGIESFSDLLREGERAVTLDIDELNSASGMLLPGDVVDLLLVSDTPNEGDDLAQPSKQIQPLIQKVTILSVDNVSLVSQSQDFRMYGYDKNFLEYSTVTVGVKYADAAKVQLAKNLGEIVFMLRNSQDQSIASNQAITSEFSHGSNHRVAGRYMLYTSSHAANGEIKPITVNVMSEQPERLNQAVEIYSNSSMSPTQ